MKQLHPKTLAYIAKTYGSKNFAGDESDPSQSEVPEASTSSSPEDEPLASAPSVSSESLPPAGFDGSPEANPNVAITPDALAQADVPPGEDLNQPAAAKGKAAGTPSLAGAFEQEKQANRDIAKAQATEGTAESSILQNAQDDRDSLPTAIELNAEHQLKDQTLLKAYNDNKLDPHRFYKNLSTGQKIISGIALVLGGIGSGLTGQPNAAAKMIDDAVNRDIDAQKNSQDQQLNLWRMNQHQYGNDFAANIATKNQLLTGVQYQLMQAAAQAKGPVAIAEANKLNAEISKSQIMNNGLLTLSSTLSGQTKEGLDEPSYLEHLTLAQRLAPELYKDAQQRYVPNVGVAKVPIDQQGRTNLEMNREYSDLLQRSIAFQNTLPLHRGAWTPDQVGKANALKQQFDEMGTRAQGINRLNKEEIKLAEEAFNPGKWTYGSAISGLKQLQQGSETRKQLLSEQYGITPFARSIRGASSTAPQPSAPQPQQQQPSATSKPQTVIQRGHVYHLNSQTGQYE